MTDDPTKRNKPDSLRINQHEDYEMAYWATKWGVTKQQILVAIAACGSDYVEKVRRQLGK